MTCNFCDKAFHRLSVDEAEAAAERARLRRWAAAAERLDLEEVWQYVSTHYDRDPLPATELVRDLIGVILQWLDKSGYRPTSESGS